MRAKQDIRVFPDKQPEIDAWGRVGSEGVVVFPANLRPKGALSPLKNLWLGCRNGSWGLTPASHNPKKAKASSP